MKWLNVSIEHLVANRERFRTKDHSEGRMKLSLAEMSPYRYLGIRQKTVLPKATFLCQSKLTWFQTVIKMENNMRRRLVTKVWHGLNLYVWNSNNVMMYFEHWIDFFQNVSVVNVITTQIQIFFPQENIRLDCIVVSDSFCMNSKGCLSHQRFITPRGSHNAALGGW